MNGRLCANIHTRPRTAEDRVRHGGGGVDGTKVMIKTSNTNNEINDDHVIITRLFTFSRSLNSTEHAGTDAQNAE